MGHEIEAYDNALEQLVADNDRMRAEIERLRAERDDYKDTATDLVKICKLKDAEIGRLHRALQKIAEYPHMAPDLVRGYAKMVLEGE